MVVVQRVLLRAGLRPARANTLRGSQRLALFALVVGVQAAWFGLLAFGALRLLG